MSSGLLERDTVAWGEHEVPWHRVGTAVPRNGQTKANMLELADANFQVTINRLAVCDEDGQPILEGMSDDGRPVYVYLPENFATVANWENGTKLPLAPVGKRFTVGQNEAALDAALAIVGAAETEACVDVVGTLFNKRQFFATIRLADLILDLPSGATDKIGNFLGVHTGHDGKTALTFANNNVRWVCANTVRMGKGSARSKFSVKHTARMDTFTVEEAREALRINADWSDSFREQAQALALVTVTPKVIDKVLAGVFPLADDATDRVKRNNDEIQGTIRALYTGPTNAGKFGESGWTLFQAVGEYLDHYRDATKDERALTSMDHRSWVTDNKLLAQELILAS